LSAGGFDIAAQVVGLAAGQWTDFDAIEDTFGAEIGPADDGIATAKQIQKLLLQSTERQASLGFALLRSHLRIKATGTFS
jgi:hypothetical protein